MRFWRKVKQQLAQLKGRNIAFAILLFQTSLFGCCSGCNVDSTCGLERQLEPGTYLIKYQDSSNNVQSKQITTDGLSCIAIDGPGCVDVISVTKVTAGGVANGKIVFQRGLDQDGQI